MGKIVSLSAKDLEGAQPAGIALSPADLAGAVPAADWEKKERIKRENESGYMAPPTLGGKLKSALFGNTDEGAEPPPPTGPHPGYSSLTPAELDEEKKHPWRASWQAMTSRGPRYEAAQRGLEHDMATKPGLRGITQLEEVGRNLAQIPFLGGAAGRLEAGLSAAAPALRAAVPVVADAAAGAGTAMLEGLSSDEPPSQIAKNAVDAVGPSVFMGQGLRVLGKGAALPSKAVRSDPWVGQYARANEAGIYDTPAMQSLPKGPAGNYEATGPALQRMLGQDRALGDAASAEYHAALNPPAGQGPLTPPYMGPRPPEAVTPPPPRAPLALPAMPPKQLGPAQPPASFAVTPGGRVMPRRPTGVPAGDSSIPMGPRDRPMGPPDTAIARQPPPGPQGMGPTREPPLRGDYMRPGAPRPAPPIDVTPEARADYGPPAPPPKPAPTRPPPRAPGEGMKRPVDRQAILSELKSARAANINPDTGLPNNPALDAQYAKAIDSMGPEGTTNTVGGSLGQRRGLQEGAGFGSNAPTDSQGATRKVYQTFRRGIRKAAPDVAAADDKYAAHASKADRRKDILFNTESDVVGRVGAHPEPLPVEHSDRLLESGHPAGPAADLKASDFDLRVGKEKAARRTIGRVGDTNVPGVEAKPYLDELAGHGPEFADALKFVKDKKAQEAVRFGLKANLPTHLAGATGPGGYLRLLGQNLRGIGAKGIDPASVAASKSLGAPGKKVALFELLRRANEDNKKKRAAAE